MTFIIFVTGLLVTGVTILAVLVGLQEAADPSQSRIEDLTEFEKRIVGRTEEGQE